MILNSDGTSYSYNYDYCNGENAAVMSTTSCTIPISSLIAAPFILPWGASIFAKIQCYNSYGDSFESTSGNGAIIYTVPDAPYGLLEDTAYRTFDQLRITWTAGAANGGTSVLHYRISYVQGSGVYSVIAEEVYDLYYSATGLTFGETYKFKVEAKTFYEYSDYSEAITLLCATLPLQPDLPTTVIFNSNCVISWVAPSDQGSAITEYKVSIRT
jgi:hypothetical protein